jgi:hypothetical protein
LVEPLAGRIGTGFQFDRSAPYQSFGLFAMSAHLFKLFRTLP